MTNIEIKKIHAGTIKQLENTLAVENIRLDELKLKIADMEQNIHRLKQEFKSLK